SADANNNGLIEVTELAGYIDEKVPELSFAAFRQRQIPQMKIVGSNFALASKTAVLSAGASTASIPASFPTGPTHVVIRSAEVYVAPDATSSVQRLEPFTAVTLRRTEAGWALVARDGRMLGYVARSDLQPLQ